jgi:tRNA pseudouridine55 synthase
MTESGFLNVFKPPGMTSHDVVAYIKRRLQPSKIGHGGTLDPVACGVLVCLVNSATRLSQQVSADTKKTYFAEAVFGIKTDTADFDGVVVEKKYIDFAKSDIEWILPDFTGEIEQTPPMASAVKVGGERLYKLHRKGETVERKPRRAMVYELKMLGFEKTEGEARARFKVVSGGGLYVRTLIEDIGAALDAPATLSFLVRTAVGPFSIETAHPPDVFSGPDAVNMLLPIDYLAR